MKLPVYQMTSLSADQLPLLNNIITRITHAINSIEFGNIAGATSNTENIWCTFVVTPGTNLVNEVCSASHLLRRKPVGTIVLWQDKAAILYKPTDATSADTSTAVFYKFNTAGTSAILLLI